MRWFGFCFKRPLGMLTREPVGSRVESRDISEGARAVVQWETAVGWARSLGVKI